MPTPPRVTAVVLAYRAEPWLERAVDALLASTGVDVDVVLVDNGCTDGAVDRLDGRDGVHVVRPGTNTGFAGGCNLGVARATGDLIALVNGDALVEPDALAHLARVAQRDDVGIATGCIRLADEPDLVNSAGNDIHCSGVSWSGGFGDKASEHAVARDVFAASGAGMVMRRDVWDQLGGFADSFFAYYEDADLSVRTWQRGYRVVYVPEAVVVHRYEFSRRAEKFFLLERNRLQMVLRCWSGRLLALLLPLLVVLEVGFLLLAVREGWWRQKVRGWAWLVRNRGAVLADRRAVQAARTVDDAQLAHLFSADLLPGNYEPPPWWPRLNTVVRAYWRGVLRLL